VCWFTPAPLAKIEITDKAQKLDEAQVAAWEKSWSTGVGWLEMEKAGQAWTREERQAVNNTTRSLLANSPSPQMVYYRPSAKNQRTSFCETAPLVQVCQQKEYEAVKMRNR